MENSVSNFEIDIQKLELKDKLAVQSSFRKTGDVDLETLKRRATFRPNMNYSCLPEGQNFIVISTIGPKEQGYDIDGEKVGVWFWGAFPDKEIAVAHMEEIVLEKNPHSMFIPFHLIELKTGRFDLQPKEEKIEKHYVNEFVDKIMQPVLKGAVDKKVELQNRKNSALSQNEHKNDETMKMNKMISFLKDKILNMDEQSLNEKKEEMKNICKETLEQYPEELVQDSNITHASNYKSLIEAVEKDGPYITKVSWLQLETYLNVLQASEKMSLSKNHRVKYYIWNFKDQSYIIRALQSKAYDSKEEQESLEKWNHLSADIQCLIDDEAEKKDNFFWGNHSVDNKQKKEESKNDFITKSINLQSEEVKKEIKVDPIPLVGNFQTNTQSFSMGQVQEQTTFSKLVDILHATLMFEK